MLAALSSSLARKPKCRCISREAPQAVRAPLGKVSTHPPGPAEAAVVPNGLARVARRAEPLPICFAPEQPTIATMRDDVVDVRCRLAPAMGAARILEQEGCPRLLPSSAVAALTSARTGSIGLGLPTPAAFARRTSGHRAAAGTADTRCPMHGRPYAAACVTGATDGLPRTATALITAALALFAGVMVRRV